MELIGSPRGSGGGPLEWERRRKEAGRQLRLAAGGAAVLLAGLVALACVGGEWSAPPRASRARFSLGAATSRLSDRGALARLAAKSRAREQQLAAATLLAGGNASAGGGGNGTQGSCARPEPQRVFYVNQLFWTWEHTLVVSAANSTSAPKDGGDRDGGGEEGGQKLGIVKSVPFSFSSQQTWTDADGHVIAKSHQDAITTVTNVFVEDCEGRQLATISEAFSPSNSAVTQYTIQNTDGDIVALSTFAKDFGTEVEINDQQTGKRLVTIFKGWGQWSDAWVAKFRPGMEQNLANDPRVIVMLLSAASSSGSWGLGGPLAVLINPLWLLLLCCCTCACCTAFSRVRENRGYDEIPSGGGAFFGQGQATGYGSQGVYGRTEYV